MNTKTSDEALVERVFTDEVLTAAFDAAVDIDDDAPDRLTKQAAAMRAVLAQALASVHVEPRSETPLHKCPTCRKPTEADEDGCCVKCGYPTAATLRADEGAPGQ